MRSFIMRTICLAMLLSLLGATAPQAGIAKPVQETLSFPRAQHAVAIQLRKERSHKFRLDRLRRMTSRQISVRVTEQNAIGFGAGWTMVYRMTAVLENGKIAVIVPWAT